MIHYPENIHAKDATTANGMTWVLRSLIGAALIGLLVVAGRDAATKIPDFVHWVEQQGSWAGLVFIGGYALAAVAFVPGSLMTLAAGAVFGLLRGTALVFVGATLGAALAFLASRYLVRSAAERRLGSYKRFAALDKAVGQDGRRIVFLLRLSPLFPFNLLNYALGLTAVSFRDYLLASVGMLPGTLLYVYYGKAAGDLATLASGTSVPRGAAYYAVMVLGLAATVLVTTLVTRSARRAL
ncbi:MAG: TVP38/TMEM64 family protein, partial [Candidatus Binatia bacterium]